MSTQHRKEPTGGIVDLSFRVRVGLLAVFGAVAGVAFVAIWVKDGIEKAAPVGLVALVLFPLVFAAYQWLRGRHLVTTELGETDDDTRNSE
jgi:hypothetical protein